MPSEPITDPTVIARIVSRHAMPLRVSDNSGMLPWEGKGRATFTLLRLPKRDVFVTCDHVLQGLTKRLQKDQTAEIVAYLPTAPILIQLNDFSLIDSERESLDVAVFRGREASITLPGLQFIDYSSSYLHDPCPGETVLIVGYPGVNISVTESNADFGYMFIALRASSVSDRRITLADEHGDRKFRDYVDPESNVTDFSKFGGLSGSPAFVIREQQYRFVGILTDGHRDGTVFVSRLGCLNDDGTLDHTRIPW